MKRLLKFAIAAMMLMGLLPDEVDGLDWGGKTAAPARGGRTGAQGYRH
jgi:hypothetical protein